MDGSMALMDGGLARCAGYVVGVTETTFTDNEE